MSDNKFKELKVIEWLGDRVRLLDQTRLPLEEVYLESDRYQDIASAIVEMKIRGAPAIGVAGAYAVALGALKIDAARKGKFLEKLRRVVRDIGSTRPTARNLFQSLERMQTVAESTEDIRNIRQALVSEALRIHQETLEADLRLSESGATLLEDGWTILTHCNTGVLATGGYGTALGVIKKAAEQGKHIEVIATETRPLLQGARLTAWELKRAGIPFHLITDSMAGYFMQQGKIDCVIVGADRIAANGDTANKIGTYTLSVLAHEHGIPFYVAAPTTTIDLSAATGDEIPIEQRKPEEVTCFRGVRTSPDGCDALNPAFDVTPHRYITAIITERGIIKEPYGEGMRGFADKLERVTDE